MSVTIAIPPSIEQQLRKFENLSEEEYKNLLALTNHIEIAHAARMPHVVALAKLRNISLEQIMLDLGLQRKMV